MVKHAAVTAVLDVLLTLDFEPRSQVAHKREAELVASHMRIAFSVPKDRRYIRSGYPSEPLLAEAAARQMPEFQKRTSDPNLMARLLMPNLRAASWTKDNEARLSFVSLFRKLIGVPC
jgi:hypothetical protein